MNAQIAGGLALAASYAAGSFPSAYMAGRITKGVDLRTVGSGNLGTTNVYRELGVGPALAVLAVDGMKGALPAALFPSMIGAGGGAAEGWALACGAASIVGHSRSMFLLWKGGGKGVATAAGVFLAVTPYATLAAIVAFIIVVAATRYVSLGSLVGGVVVPVAEWLRAGPTPAFFAGLAVAAFIAFTHRSNIQRLAAGTERRIGRAGGGSPAP